MTKPSLILLALLLFAVGCAAPRRQSPSARPAPASMPDARDLAEHPLDVLSMPQP